MVPYCGLERNALHKQLLSWQPKLKFSLLHQNNWAQDRAPQMRCLQIQVKRRPNWRGKNRLKWMPHPTGRLGRQSPRPPAFLDLDLTTTEGRDLDNFSWTNITIRGAEPRNKPTFFMPHSPFTLLALLSLSTLPQILNPNTVQNLHPTSDFKGGTS